MTTGSRCLLFAASVVTLVATLLTVMYPILTRGREGDPSGEIGVDREDSDFFNIDLSKWYGFEIAELREGARAMREISPIQGEGRRRLGEEQWEEEEREILDDLLHSRRDQQTSDLRGRANNRGGGGKGRNGGSGGSRAIPPFTWDLNPQPEPAAMGDKKYGRVKISTMKKPEPTSRAEVRAMPDFKCYDTSPDRKVPCPPPDLGQACDKYNGGDFKKCYQYCKPSFCCIHDSLSTSFSPSCKVNREPNCPSYWICYIVWWKLHDTVGPATYLRLEQDEPFYDTATFDFIESDLTEDLDFFQQLFGHHFDGDDGITDDLFEDPENW